MDLEKALKKLIFKDPFYGLFLLNLDKQYTDKLDATAAVARNGINCTLLINKEKWDELDDEEQLFVLKHEANHIILKHFFVGKDLANHEVANISGDCELNQYIDPERKYIHKYFYPENINCPPKLGLREYYRRIMNNETPIKVISIGVDSNGTGELVDDHGQWKDFDDLSDAERDLISQQVDHIAKNTAEQTIKQRGKIPGQFQEYIDSLFKQKPAIFNWKKYFRRLIGTAISIDLKKTRKKESIRFPDASAVKYRKKSKILVAVDTSGSVNDKEICDFFSEINHIYKAGAEIDICEADAAVERVYRYNGKWDMSVTGRGGTSFDPPCQYFNEHRDYTMMVYFTDGYAPLPSIRIRNNQIIWIITSNGRRQDYSGKVIYIPNEC